MRYENYTTMERVDDILDKISKYGINSLTKLEKDFLDAHSTGDEEEIHTILTKEESEKVFEDDNGYFKFILDDIKDFGSYRAYKGTLFVPDLELSKSKKIEGILKGEIISYSNGSSISFEKKGYDVFEFCNGLEHELDIFIDYVSDELKNYEI